MSEVLLVSMCGMSQLAYLPEMHHFEILTTKGRHKKEHGFSLNMYVAAGTSCEPSLSANCSQV